jgi:hypothetical protein
MAKEKQTRKRSLRMAAIWKKTLRQIPLEKLRMELAGQTNTKILRKEPFTPSLVLPRLRHKESPWAPDTSQTYL